VHGVAVLLHVGANRESKLRGRVVSVGLFVYGVLIVVFVCVCVCVCLYGGRGYGR
jgi:hypothetical protein